MKVKQYLKKNVNFSNDDLDDLFDDLSDDELLGMDGITVPFKVTPYDFTVSIGNSNVRDVSKFAEMILKSASISSHYEATIALTEDSAQAFNLAIDKMNSSFTGLLDTIYRFILKLQKKNLIKRSLKYFAISKFKHNILGLSFYDNDPSRNSLKNMICKTTIDKGRLNPDISIFAPNANLLSKYEDAFIEAVEESRTSTTVNKLGEDLKYGHSIWSMTQR